MGRNGLLLVCQESQRITIIEPGSAGSEHAGRVLGDRIITIEEDNHGGNHRV